MTKIVLSRWLLPATVMMLLWGVFPAWGKDLNPTNRGDRATVHVGDYAPNFTVPLTTNGTFSLWDYAGAIILINFWGDY